MNRWIECPDSPGFWWMRADCVDLICEAEDYRGRILVVCRGEPVWRSKAASCLFQKVAPPDSDVQPNEPASPAGCVCDPRSWGEGVLPPICDAYSGHAGGYCAICEHDEECHRLAANEQNGEPIPEDKP